MRALLAIAALALSACASSHAGRPLEFSEPPSLEAEPFQAKGTLITWGNSVSYDEHQIVGPQVDVALLDGREWAGSMYGRNVRLAVRGGGELEGLGDKLVFRRDGDTVRVEGRWAYRHVRIEVSPSHLLFRDGQRAYDLRTKGPGCLGNEVVGCIVKAQGDAARLSDAAMPQFALALIAAFPFREER